MLKLFRSPNPDQHARTKLKPFIRDGLWAALSEGVAENNFLSFATYLQATPRALGVLVLLQHLVGCAAAFFGETFVRMVQSRKTLVLLGVAFQSFTFLLILGEIIRGPQCEVFLFLVLLFTASAGIAETIWSTWMSDLLPYRRRGYCFGIRHQKTWFIQFVSLIVGGFFLNWASSQQGGSRAAVYWAFGGVFAVGALAKYLSFLNLRLQNEKPFVLPTQQDAHPLYLLRHGFGQMNLNCVLFFYFLVGFGINLSMPFHSNYVFQDLHYSFFQYSMIIAVYMGARYCALATLGRMVDRIGARPLLLGATAFLFVNPIGWCLSPNYATAMVVQVVAGLNWAIFELATFVFLSESFPPQLRQRVFALKFITYGLGFALGALFGGVFITWNHGVILSAYWLSGAVRFCSALWLLFTLKTQHFEHRSAGVHLVVTS